MGFFFNFALMNLILFDNNRENYYPLSFTRPIAEFRIGILTIKEKWEKYYKSVSIKTEDYLAVKFPIEQTKDTHIWIMHSISLLLFVLFTNYHKSNKQITKQYII